MPIYSDPLTLVMTMLFFFVVPPILCVLFLLRFRWAMHFNRFRLHRYRGSNTRMSNSEEKKMTKTMREVQMTLQDTTVVR